MVHVGMVRGCLELNQGTASIATRDTAIDRGKSAGGSVGGGRQHEVMDVGILSVAKRLVTERG
jgi:hypothetical protein